MAMRKAPPRSRAKAGYKKPTDNSNTAKMNRLSPSPKRLNAKGAKGKMRPTKQGSGYPMTKRTKPAAKRTRRQPDLY